MKNEEAIKQKIVTGYRRGVCDKNGNTLPKSKWGQNGKGSAFHNDYNTPEYRENHERIFGESKLNIWPRDLAGNLIED
jgi:hypothetical protein